MVVLVVVFCRLFTDVHQMSCFRLFSSPFSSSRLFHTPLAPKPRCGSVFSGSFFACYLSRRVRSRQLNSVSWMLLQCAARRRRPVPIERRGGETTGTLTISTEPPYNIQVGYERTVQEECATAFSVQCSQNRNVQATFISPRTPITHHTSNPNHSPVTHRQSPSTEVLANQLIGTCAR